MSPFWLAAATFAVVAVAFVVPPLLGRAARKAASREDVNAAIYRERMAELDEEYPETAQNSPAYETAKAELLTDLARETATEVTQAPTRTASQPTGAVIIATAIPLSALLVYLVLGRPGLFLPEPAPHPLASRGSMPIQPAPPATAPAPQRENVPPIEQMVAGLEGRLADNPADPEGWVLLSRSYAELEQFERAEATLTKGLIANPEHPDLLIAKAETIARRQGNRLTGEPTTLLRQAITANPTHRKGLWLTGIAALQARDAQAALAFWARLRATGPMDPEDDKLLNRFIAEAQTQLGRAPSAPSPPAASQPPTAPATTPVPAETPARLAVTVHLSPSLLEKAALAETVFVFARAAQGPRMPLAIVRRSVADLPLELVLDDSMAMMPTMRLSAFPDVIVGARISKSGNAMPAPGDLFGEVGPLSRDNTEHIAVTIDQIVR